MTNIASIEARRQFYRCENGRTYLKVSESLHVEAKWVGNAWIEEGRTERLNPNELVEAVGVG